MTRKGWQDNEVLSHVLHQLTRLGSLSLVHLGSLSLVTCVVCQFTVSSQVWVIDRLEDCVGVRNGVGVGMYEVSPCGAMRYSYSLVSNKHGTQELTSQDL